MTESIIINQQVVWQRFERFLNEIKNLRTELSEMDGRRESICLQLEAKQNLLAEMTGLSWEQVRANLVISVLETESDVQSPEVVGQKKVSVKNGSVPYWVLRAIAHYEDNNPQSRIDKRSIQIYINDQAPGLLDKFNPNTLFTTLSELKRKELIVLMKGRRKKTDRSQYNLTQKGRSALN